MYYAPSLVLVASNGSTMVVESVLVLYFQREALVEHMTVLRVCTASSVSVRTCYS
jgi:hypothetical protein